MIKPHDKISWLEDGRRYFGFVHCIVNRQAYQTAMIEHQGKYLEFPLEQLRLENQHD